MIENITIKACDINKLTYIWSRNDNIAKVHRNFSLHISFEINKIKRRQQNIYSNKLT